MGITHFVGVLYHIARSSGLAKRPNLKIWQHRLVKSVDETEQCERLIKNVLPPHLMDKLGATLKAADSNLFEQEKIAEKYDNCSFLFAKIGGLAQLVNDQSIHPVDMMRVLQIIFDHFDQLADTYGVQKVRKTANEYYLVAAGLPNPALPTPGTRGWHRRLRLCDAQCDEHHQPRA